MSHEEVKSKVDELLQKRYGIGIIDTNEQLIDNMVLDGEDPEAIVDEIGRKYDMDRIDLGIWG